MRDNYFLNKIIDKALDCLLIAAILGMALMIALILVEYA